MHRSMKYLVFLLPVWLPIGAVAESAPDLIPELMG